jgi:hypothetical protein
MSGSIRGGNGAWAWREREAPMPEGEETEEEAVLGRREEVVVMVGEYRGSGEKVDLEVEEGGVVR